MNAVVARLARFGLPIIAVAVAVATDGVATPSRATGRIVLPLTRYAEPEEYSRVRVLEADVTRRRCRVISAFRGGSASQLSADGRRVAIGGGTTADRVRVFDVASGRQLFTASGTLSPQFRRVAYQDGRDLVVTEIGGARHRTVATTAGTLVRYGPVSWSRAGTWVAYSVSSGGDPRPGEEGKPLRLSVHAVRGDGRMHGVLYHEPRPYEFLPSPTWSPDGRTLAVAWSSRAAIFRIDLDGRRLRALTRAGTEPVWSPDGRRLAYQEQAVLGPVWTMSADGSRKRRLTSAPSSVLAWSPDGTWIAYEQRHNLAVMRQDGREARIICPLPRDYDLSGTVVAAAPLAVWVP